MSEVFEQTKRPVEYGDQPNIVPAGRPGDLRWFVVQSKPREEERARHFLEEKGMFTYLPHMEIARARGSRGVLIRKPLFPGYLFCLFNPEASLAYVRWTRGVRKILPESVSPEQLVSGIDPRHAHEALAAAGLDAGVKDYRVEYVLGEELTFG